MILTDRIAHGVASGDITVAFRRWKHPRVTPGSTFHTVAGIVRIEGIEQTDLEQLDAIAAQTAGYTTRDELIATFHGHDTDPLWRVTLSWAGPDPRDTLAGNSKLSTSDIADITALLDRLDTRTPWARATLDRLAQEPGITAAQLAAELPMDKDSLKRRIRSLKEHGLTRSLPSGYELSARGHAFLSATDPEDPAS